jgi:hypothetical protein
MYSRLCDGSRLHHPDLPQYLERQLTPEPTPEQIAKLPKWAQRHIRQLESTTRRALKRLEENEDGQTPSGIWYEDFVFLGGENIIHRTYVQSDKLEIEHQGVRLAVTAFGDDPINLRWGPAGSLSAMGDICFIPTSYQQARLTNMVHTPIEYERLRRQAKHERKSDE